MISQNLPVDQGNPLYNLVLIQQNEKEKPYLQGQFQAQPSWTERNNRSSTCDLLRSEDRNREEAENFKHKSPSRESFFREAHREQEHVQEDAKYTRSATKQRVQTTEPKEQAAKSSCYEPRGASCTPKQIRPDKDKVELLTEILKMILKFLLMMCKKRKIKIKNTV